MVCNVNPIGAWLCSSQGSRYHSESSILVSLMYRMPFPSRESFLLVLLCQSFGICSHNRRVGGHIGVFSLVPFMHSILMHVIVPLDAISLVLSGPVLRPLASGLVLHVAQTRRHPAPVLH